MALKAADLGRMTRWGCADCAITRPVLRRATLTLDRCASIIRMM
jgi:hypothetical protein